MTLKKTSMKILSVFLALIMILGVCAPIVSATAHDHEHARNVEIDYDEAKVRDYLNAIINKLIGEDAFFADYTVSKDSYYLAIGDDTGYAAALAGKLGIENKQYTTATWDTVDDKTIAKADLITLSYSESMISGIVADVMNGETTIEWTNIVSEKKADYIEKAIDYVVKAVLAKRFENNFSVDVPEEGKVRNAVEAYFYGYIAFAKDYSDMVEKISTANPDATVVLLGNYNAFADLGLEISFDDIVIDLSDYLTEGRQQTINDYVNNFLDTITELKEGFTGSEESEDADVALDMPVDENALPDSLKAYLKFLKDEYMVDGTVQKEEFLKDIVNDYGTIDNYITTVETQYDRPIEEWDEALKTEIAEELGDEFDEAEIDAMVEAEFSLYKDEIEAAKKVKKTYEEQIAAYEEDLYNLISDLIADAQTARGVILDLKSTFAFEYDLLIALAKKIDPEILKDPDIIGAIGEDRAEKLKEIQTKLMDKIEKKLIDLGWIEEDTLEVLTLDLIYENLHKLDKKTQEWFNSFDRATVTKMLGGLVVYSEDILVFTEKGLEQFNSIYDNIADTEITIKGDSVDVAAVLSAPSSILSIFYAGALDNFIFVDISEVETGLDKIKATDGMDYIKAYIDDTSVANATANGSAYIAEQIYDALTVTCVHEYTKATCTEPATCIRCGATNGSALGHDFGAATCTEPAKCSRCGATNGNALGHTPGDWEITREATKEQDGEKVRKCTVCGAIVETESIPFEDETNEPEDPGNTGEEEEEDDGLPVWAIVLIVIGSVLVVGGAGFAIYWFVIRKKKQGAIDTLTK